MIVSSPPTAATGCRALVDQELRRVVGQLEPSVRDLAEYHMGWRDEHGNHVDGGGGKGVRTVLALLGAEACGSDPATGVPGAVSVELVHNFSLIHDDVIDGDEQRRHRPTLWALFGVDRALVVADALFALAFQELLQLPSGAPAAAALAAGSLRMIHGQADDMAFVGQPSIAVEDVVAMSSKKTGAILGCAASIGALLADAPADRVDALREFGEHLGLAFQATDDVLGIWGDRELTGKPVGSDLTEGRRTLPVVLGLQHPEHERLHSLLQEPQLADEEVEEVTALLAEVGVRRDVEAMADRHLARALVSLERFPCEPAALDALTALAHFVCRRSA